jgi:hypothetical protein
MQPPSSAVDDPIWGIVLILERIAERVLRQEAEERREAESTVASRLDDAA